MVYTIYEMKKMENEEKQTMKRFRKPKLKMIGVEPETYVSLFELKKAGDTFDDIISMLLKKYFESAKEEEGPSLGTKLPSSSETPNKGGFP